MGHLQKLPLGVDNLLVPPIKEDSLLPQPFFVNGDRRRGRYARERAVLLDGNVKIFRLSQPAERLFDSFGIVLRSGWVLVDPTLPRNERRSPNDRVAGFFLPVVVDGKDRTELVRLRRRLNGERADIDHGVDVALFQQLEQRWRRQLHDLGVLHHVEARGIHDCRPCGLECARAGGPHAQPFVAQISDGLDGRVFRDEYFLNHRQPAADDGQIQALVHLQDCVDPRVSRRQGFLGRYRGEKACERPSVNGEIDAVLGKHTSILRDVPVQYKDAVLGYDSRHLLEGLPHRRQTRNNRDQRGYAGQYQLAHHGIPPSFRALQAECP